jgi:hypothetical protein
VLLPQSLDAAAELVVESLTAGPKRARHLTGGFRRTRRNFALDPACTAKSLWSMKRAGRAVLSPHSPGHRCRGRGRTRPAPAP